MFFKVFRPIYLLKSREKFWLLLLNVNVRIYEVEVLYNLQNVIQHKAVCKISEKIALVCRDILFKMEYTHTHTSHPSILFLQILYIVVDIQSDSTLALYQLI